MIDTTLGAIVIAEPALTRLADDRLPLQLAHDVSKWLEVVGAELKHFYEARNKLVQEYGAIPEGGAEADIKVDPTSPRWSDFCAKIDELVAVRVAVPLAPLDLAASPTLTITPADLLKLKPFRKEAVDGK